MSLEERIAPYTTFLTEGGRKQLCEAIGKWREAYGADWLDEMRRVTPTTCTIIDLCANRTFDESWTELNALADEWISEEDTFTQLVAIALKDTALAPYKGNLQLLHAAVRAEIDRPRF